jgi:hypothetical protein
MNIQRQVGSKLELISIHKAEAQELLAQAYPSGWGFAPYVVVVHRGKIVASQGFGAFVRLARLMGLRRTWGLWTKIDRFRSRPVQFIGSASSPRRRFLKASVITTAITGLIGTRPTISFACIPCESCGFRKAHVSCTTYYNDSKCKDNATNKYKVCFRYNYYDSVTGEFCFTGTECSCKGNPCP